MCQPNDPGSVALLLDIGAAIHVAGALWRTRLKILPGAGISPRAVGGGFRPAPGKARTSSISPRPRALSLPSSSWSERAPLTPRSAIANAYAGPIEWPPELDARRPPRWPKWPVHFKGTSGASGCVGTTARAYPRLIPLCYVLRWRSLVNP